MQVNASMSFLSRKLYLHKHERFASIQAMKIFDRFNTATATSRLSDEVLYAAVSEEIEKGIKREGLWMKAFAQAKGDETQAKVCYVELRVQSLKDEAKLARAIADQEQEDDLVHNNFYANEVMAKTSEAAKAKKLHRNKEQADKAYYEKYVTKSAETPNTPLYVQYLLWGSFTLTCLFVLVVIIVDASY